MLYKKWQKLETMRTQWRSHRKENAPCVTLMYQVSTFYSENKSLSNQKVHL